MSVFKSDYSYELPENLIATHPFKERAQSKMLVLDRESRLFQHQRFFDFPNFLEEGSIIVLNDSKVIPARLPGKRASGASLEVLLVSNQIGNRWHCKMKNLGKLQTGETFFLCDEALRATLLEKLDDGSCVIEFETSADLIPILEKIGYAPLPPYIQKMRQEETDREEDLQCYQTVYADTYGSIAAPTAGFHFTSEVLEKLSKRGIEVCRITLHVGLGTFEPIREDDASKHTMHEERFEISEKTAAKILRAKKENRKVVTIGTTTTRALESAWDKDNLKTGPQSTRLFVHPPYQFKIIDQLLTNFHLPESTLMMLVAALTGRELLLEAYREAIQKQYRFYSFGDCMFIR